MFYFNRWSYKNVVRDGYISSIAASELEDLKLAKKSLAAADFSNGLPRIV